MQKILAIRDALPPDQDTRPTFDKEIESNKITLTIGRERVGRFTCWRYRCPLCNGFQYERTTKEKLVAHIHEHFAHQHSVYTVEVEEG